MAKSVICGLCVTASLYVLSAGAEPSMELSDNRSQPGIAFLEYLADMELDRGVWLDAIQLNELAKNEKDEINDENFQLESTSSE